MAKLLVLSVLLAMLEVVWSMAALMGDPHYTCRLPVLDRNRNYYIAARAHNDNKRGVYACFQYGDVSGGNGSVIVAMRCEMSGGHTSQLILDPQGIEPCRKQISASQACNGQGCISRACNILQGSGRVQQVNREVFSLATVRLTGQAPNGSVDNLDKLFVTSQAILCTESFNEPAVPLAEARLCQGGHLHVSSMANNGMLLKLDSAYSCLKIIQMANM